MPISLVGSGSRDCEQLQKVCRQRLPEVPPVPAALVVSHIQYSIPLSVFTSICCSTHQSPNQEAYRGMNNAAGV